MTKGLDCGEGDVEKGMRRRGCGEGDVEKGMRRRECGEGL